MKILYKLLTILVLLGFSSHHSAMAHRFHHHGGGFYGGSMIGFYSGFHYPPPYYPPYYAYPPPVITLTPSAPPIYIERDDIASAPELPANFWYYCQDPDGYYPYVKQCPGGWVQVPPRPLR